MGPLSSKDMLFLGIARDLELYTTEEVMSIRSAGIMKSSSDASLSLSYRRSHLWPKYNLPPLLPRYFLIVLRLSWIHHPRGGIMQVL